MTSYLLSYPLIVVDRTYWESKNLTVQDLDHDNDKLKLLRSDVVAIISVNEMKEEEKKKKKELFALELVETTSSESLRSNYVITDHNHAHGGYSMNPQQAIFFSPSVVYSFAKLTTKGRAASVG